jgi:hypothetical protein
VLPTLRVWTALRCSSLLLPRTYVLSLLSSSSSHTNPPPPSPLHLFPSEQKVPVTLVALINDTTGTMIASSYVDQSTRAGIIFGTGCNAAYMERIGNIPKIKDLGLPEDELMAINCEWCVSLSLFSISPLLFELEADDQHLRLCTGARSTRSRRRRTSPVPLTTPSSTRPRTSRESRRLRKWLRDSTLESCSVSSCAS